MRTEKTERYEFMFEGDFKQNMKPIINEIESKLNLYSRQNDLLEVVLSFGNNPTGLLIRVNPALDEGDISSFKGYEGVDFLKIVVQELEFNKIKYNKDNINYQKYLSVSEGLTMTKNSLFPEPPVVPNKGIKP